MKSQSDKQQGSRIAELEKELEIEASLERVRAQAMRMTRPDELLGICEILFTELEKLGFNEIRNSQIFIYNDHKGSFMNYGFSVYEGAAIAEIYYTSHPKVNAFVTAVRKTNDAFAELAISGDELKAWRDYRIENGEPDDPRLAHIDTLYYYFYSIGAGAIGISNFESISAAQLEVLKRFRNVFDFAYRRYTDVSQAEAQAREAQIELGLERVRSRAMAMHKTDELRGAAELLYKELVGLGIGSITVCYVLVNEKDKTGAYYGANPIDGKIPSQPTIMPHTETKVMRALWASWLKQEPVHFIVLDPKASLAHQTYIGKLIAAQGNIPGFTAEGFLSVSPERVHIYSLNFKQGYLFLVGGAPLPAADVDILTRFTKVFELTYTRFLDLKNAEAQTREAQIELALERVRAKTMAMHNSEDVGATVATMFDELVKLGVDKTMRFGVGIIHNSKEFEVWTASTKTTGEVVLNIGTIDMMTHPLMEGLYYEWKAKKDHYTYLLLGEEVKNYYKAINDTNCYTVKFDIDALPSKQISNCFIFPEGALYTFSPEPLTQEASKIATRFASVFSQTYRRYRDLQIAETQAREAQIQLALERVRARTMAMQHSDELAETAYILFQQFRDLGENPDQATIGIINEADGVIEYWVTLYGSQANRVFKFPIDESNVTHKIYKAWKAHHKSLVIDLSGKALHDFSKFRESMGGAGYNPEEKRRIINVAFFSKGLINVQSTVERSVESLRLLERFANVFEGTYTRFLDLKKAEAQAREAQIELALERVRARAMAMRDSKELSDMVSTVFDELTKLDFALTRCAIVIADADSSGRMIWMANSEAGQPPISFYRKSLDHPYPNAANEEWKKRTPKWVYHLKGAEKKAMDDYYANSEEVAHMPSAIRQAMDMPESIILSHSFNNFGYLRADSLEPLSEANLDILYRFAKVFDLGYTRFTDIKQAEAQAREAQIELALERVRAKTMAMQHSNELLETSQVVFQQLRDLGETADQIGIAIVKEDEGVFDLFATLYGTQMVRVFQPKIDDHFIMGRVYKNWKAHKKSFVVELGGEELQQYNILRNQLGGQNYYNENIGLDDRWIVFCAGFSKGILSFSSSTEPTREAAQLLERFAQVFEQTYTRFLDLKKAEAQARESQIQLALERVRARTMAMQQSTELAETASLVSQQLHALGLSFSRVGFYIWQKDTGLVEGWTSNGNFDGLLPPLLLPYMEDDGHRGIFEAAQRGEHSYEQVLGGDELKSHYEWLLSQPSVWGTLKQTGDDAFVPMPIQYKYAGIFKQGYLMLMATEPLPEAGNLLERFALVFEQTYTRFLDLKQAEEQAREAQIELGLERVRARAMAMQNSGEINDLIGAVFYELTKLDLIVTRCRLWIFDPASLSCMTWQANQETPAHPLGSFIKYNEQPFYLAILNAWKEGSLKLVYELKGGEKKSWDEFLFNETEFSRLPEVVKEGMRSPERVLLSASFGNFGAMQTGSLDPLSDKQMEILSRFVKVFDMSYTRFNDLKQAEAQSREAQIQLALERVRARTMAMQKSDELVETAMTLFQQFSDLGVKPERIFIGDMDENTRMIEFWGTDLGGEHPRFEVNADATIGFSQIYKAWKAKKKAHTVIMKGQELADHVRYVQDVLHMPMQPELVQRQRIMYSAFFSKGLLMIVTPEIQSNETLGILERFAGVFDGTYTRFLDLQKAEAQARESQIQLALERVRARTMAMQKSEELAETASVLFQQLLNLGIRSERTIIGIPNEDTRKIEFWGTEQGGNQINTRFEYEADATYAFREIYKAWQEKRNELTVILKGKNLEEHVNYVRNVLHMPLLADLVQKQRMLYNAFFSKGWLEIVTPDTQSKETLDILQRFAGVFDGTYTRFLDLQKAEAQAREAKIVAALERIRSRSLAMFKTDDLRDVLSVVFEQMQGLSVDMGFASVNIYIFEEGTRNHIMWARMPDGVTPMRVPYVEDPIISDLFDAKESGVDYFEKAYSVEEKNACAEKLFELSDYKYLPKEIKTAMVEAPGYAMAMALAKNSGICVPSFVGKYPSAEDVEVMKRVARVFEQSYIRFLDLQRAEAQAREAQIEASLERVRGKAMAMRNSGDLSAAASTVFTELRNLGINPIRSGVGLLTADSRKAKIYSNTSTQTAADLALMGEVTLAGHPVFEQQYQSWLSQDNYFVALGGKELASYYKILSAGLNADLDISVKIHQKEFGHWFMFSEGFLYAWSDKEYTDAEMKILERFKNVIELTFRRYIELQKSETQARDAVRQASLDRVRAEIASMRTVSDLDRITPLIWNELTILGVPFIRCGVFIMDEPQQLIHTYLSTPDGKAIAAFQLHFNSDTGNGVNQTALRGWREKQVVTLHWTEEEFKNFSHALVEQGEIASEEGYLTERPPSGLDLHFFPFLQGMLYAGNTEPLSEDDKDLVQSLADAFSTAYARYEDFNRLELAKQEVERTLIDLKAAQTRLIQSEKMASLGELTAGIAHEIQNPLNFVNNFSEVNQEMIDELEEELNAGNIEEALALAADIKQNEQKINHHGKRADGIVKGMLQHSRTTGGEKLPTNINSVAEEYMRLSYHGLRAKDKSFNAEMVMHFDPDLPKIQAVGQDIGRVMLNLFNNAFYAVNQKKKTVGSGYNPEVSVSTSAEDGQIIIKVKDNGVGMPDQVKEKIMQPFFTTKPTGEGTGLGLSLTYDMVVKGHGGSIQVNSAEGEGSEFIISLPTS